MFFGSLSGGRTAATPSAASAAADDTLAALAAVLIGLDPKARAKLAAMLLRSDR